MTLAKNQIREILLYSSIREKVKVSVHFQNGTFWLTQKAIAELFGIDRTVVTKHLKKIFETNELHEVSVSANFALTMMVKTIKPIFIV
jgi:hypothetical protein